jgi:hypothetical protein
VIIGLGSNQHATPAPCCNPIPGERIVGIVDRARASSVHAIDCGALVAYEDEPDRWIDLRWAGDSTAAEHEVRIEVTLANDTGVLGRICTLIGEQRANITDIIFHDRKPDFYRMVVDIEVRDMEHLTNVMTAIDADSGRGRGAPLPRGRRRGRGVTGTAWRRRGERATVFRRRDKRPLSTRSRGLLSPARLGALDRVRRPPRQAHPRHAAPHRARLLLRGDGLLHAVLRAALLSRGRRAWLLRANVLASLIGTVAGNPLTFPFIASISLGLGRRILGYGVTGRDFGRVVDAFSEAAVGIWRGLLATVGLARTDGSGWSRFSPTSSCRISWAGSCRA